MLKVWKKEKVTLYLKRKNKYIFHFLALTSLCNFIVQNFQEKKIIIKIKESCHILRIIFVYDVFNVHRRDLITR